MKFQQIRNATIIISYADKKFLIDPWLADKGTYPSVPSQFNEESNPLVALPLPKEEIIDVDAVILTHLHFDHFDEAAKNILPKIIPMFVQNQKEALQMQKDGFLNVDILSAKGSNFEEVKLLKTPGKHGQGEIVDKYFKELQIDPEVCGVIFKHPNEKTLYIAGDTIWCDDVKNTIDKYQPDVIILNACAAQFYDSSPIIMGAKDLHEVFKAAPKATIIASHMEAVNHGVLNRTELQNFVDEQGLTARVLIPKDGQSYIF